jgi:hypothetical protein
LRIGAILRPLPARIETKCVPWPKIERDYFRPERRKNHFVTFLLHFADELSHTSRSSNNRVVVMRAWGVVPVSISMPRESKKDMQHPNTKAICLGLLLAGVSIPPSHAAPPATPQGAITVREFRPAAADIASLTNLASFPDSPDVLEYSPRFEWPTTADGSPPPGDSGKNNYGVQIIGYFYPPTSGNYTFAIASDDNGRLFLSTDSNPANKQLIAQEAQWNGVRNFGNPEGTDRRRTIVDAATGRSSNVSVPIALVANTPYYIEALMSEGTGGDSLAVTYTTDGTFPEDAAEPIPGTELRSIDKADGPLALTTSPESLTVPAGSSVTFRVGVPNGTPPYTYEWFRDGAPLYDDLGNPIAGQVYSIPRVETTDNNAKFTVQITNPSSTITTPEATLTVTSDTAPPTMTRVMASDSFNSVTVTYSEPMDDAAADPANYTISGGVTVESAEFVQADPNDPAAVANRLVVRIATSVQPQAGQFTLTVNAANVKDLFGNGVAPNTATFRSFEFRTGVVLYKRWLATGLSALTNDPVRFPDSPDVVETRTLVETGGDFADNFSSQMKGFFIPATTGDYVFFGAADDNMFMFLSTDDSPANAHLILADIGWQNNREWTGLGGATTTGNGTDTAYVYRRGQVNDADPFGPWVGPFENRSDEFLTSATVATLRGGIDTSNPWPTTDADGNAVISLTAGERYYFEVYHQEGGGGDRAQVTFKLEGAADPANGTESAMRGNLIGAVVDPSSFPPTITSRPTNSYNFNKGDTLTFSVTADNPAPGDLSYQWNLNKKAIPGATNSTLTVTDADVDDIGDYSVDVRNVNGVASSRPDNDARAIMRGAFIIEAEDYNHTRGQTVAAASTMPLATNYYGGLDGIPGIDFKLIDQATTDSAASGAQYRNGYVLDGVTTPFPTTPEDALGNVSVDLNNGDRNRGDTILTNNYKIGWGTAGEWFQYTRSFPPGDYNAVLAASRDGLTTNAISFALDTVSGDVGTTNVTVTPIGTFTTSQTGGWSSNDLVPFRAADGSLATYTLGASSTLRLTITLGDPDLDYILLYPVGGGGGGDRPAISIDTNASGAPVITFEGTLESSTTVDGTFSDVTGATSPYTAPTTSPAQFFRAKRLP